MNATVRGIRGDLAISARPACLLILIGVTVIAGLSSAVIQDASYAQLANARFTIKQHPWDQTSCTQLGTHCAQLRARAARESLDFLAEQRRIATHIAALQTPTGVLEYASRFMALGVGAIVIALLGTLTIAGEWIRGTMGIALSGLTPTELARRRLITLFILAGIAFVFAVVGTATAAVWGRAARPLGEASGGTPWQSLLGAAAVVAAYCAITTAVAWSVREAMRTLLFTAALVAAIAFTTTLGAPTPGAAVASALGIHRLLEIEVGYFWIWPPLTFYPGTASAARIPPTLPWAAAVATVLLCGGVALASLKRSATRSDPLTHST